jgi:3-isopropylmalate/(R)-2-methylmalate dehydratase small subunit
MTSIIRGTAWTFGDDVSTDHIIPGKYYHLRGDLAALARHALEDADPEFAEGAEPGVIVVAGKNFGQGSSREHAALVLRERGVLAVLAQSMARIFYRNAVNVGLPPVICDTSAITMGDQLELELGTGTVRNLTTDTKMSFEPLPPVMRAILADGGLVPHLLKHGGYAWQPAP